MSSRAFCTKCCLINVRNLAATVVKRCVYSFFSLNKDVLGSNFLSPFNQGNVVKKHVLFLRKLLLGFPWQWSVKVHANVPTSYNITHLCSFQEIQPSSPTSTYYLHTCLFDRFSVAPYWIHFSRRRRLCNTELGCIRLWKLRTALDIPTVHKQTGKVF